MSIDRTGIAAMLLSAAQLLLEHTDELSLIDSRFGDGDHGITISTIARLVQQETPQWGERSIRTFLDDLGRTVMEVKGGSSGPLYGTMISGLGASLGQNENELNADGVRRMFSGCLAEMEDITTAKIGDKTMMDALIPAVEAVQRVQVQGSEKDLLEAAAAAAEAGAKASEQFVARFGRARSYKEQTIGTPDAGALSTALFIRGMAQGLSAAGSKPNSFSLTNAESLL